MCLGLNKTKHISELHYILNLYNMIIDVDYNSNHNFILKFIGGHKDNHAWLDGIQSSSMPKQSLIQAMKDEHWYS